MSAVKGKSRSKRSKFMWSRKGYRELMATPEIQEQAKAICQRVAAICNPKAKAAGVVTRKDGDKYVLEGEPYVVRKFPGKLSSGYVVRTNGFAIRYESEHKALPAALKTMVVK